MRGPGEFFGTRQSGLPSLRVGDLGATRMMADALEIARELSQRFRADAPAAGLARRPGRGRSAGAGGLMRVIAGESGARSAAPAWDGSRPTPDRLRETLFNILAPHRRRQVLDVCAGTGAVGIEALSRGAAAVTFVEEDRRALALIEVNLRHCEIREGYTIERRIALARAAVFAGRTLRHRVPDPPTRSDPSSPGCVAAPSGAWRDRHPRARVAAGGARVADGLAVARRLRQGDSALTFYAPGTAGTEAE